MLGHYVATMHPYSDIPEETVASLGEEKLIREMRGWLGRASPSQPFGIGDDCAVISPPKHGLMQLVTVDPVIHGRHFDDSVSPKAAGEKLFKRNLSDIAAMGGTPKAAVVALAMEKRVSIAWLHEFYKGLAAVSLRVRVPVVGGDVAQLPSGFVATLTLLGEASGHRVLTRKGARLGDHIYVTGRLGGSLASGHHFKFQPRLQEGRWLAWNEDVVSMMDISDGLAKDIRSLTPEGCAPLLGDDKIPIRKGCDLRAALCDGEDYELLFCMKAGSDTQSFERAFTSRFPKTPLHRIGSFGNALPEVVEQPGLVPIAQFQGFEHLRG